MLATILAALMKQQGAKRSMLPLSEKIWRAHLLMRRNFRQCGSTALQKNHSLLATRHSLSFRLGKNLALPNFCR
jgi:hypothetical protein